MADAIEAAFERLSLSTSRQAGRVEGCYDRFGMGSPFPMNSIKRLLARRLVIVMGKGGVGKTVFSAALATVAARAGIRTLAMECDPRAPLRALCGKPPGFDPVAISPGLSAMVLDGQRSLDEYLQIVVPARLILKAVFASKLYQYFVQAAPGLQELMMLGKIYFEIAQKKPAAARPELIVLDAPASGQALGLLKMPAAAQTTFGNSIVGRESSNIDRLLHDQRRCAIVLVATPEPLALQETIETKRALETAGFFTAAIVLNRSSSLAFDEGDVMLLKRNSTLRRHLTTLDHLSSIAIVGLERYRAAREAIAVLTKAGDVPVVQINDFRGLAGLSLLGAIVDALGDKPQRGAAESI